MPSHRQTVAVYDILWDNRDPTSQWSGYHLKIKYNATNDLAFPASATETIHLPAATYFAKLKFNSMEVIYTCQYQTQNRTFNAFVPLWCNDIMRHMSESQNMHAFEFFFSFSPNPQDDDGNPFLLIGSRTIGHAPDIYIQKAVGKKISGDNAAYDSADEERLPDRVYARYPASLELSFNERVALDRWMR